MTLSQCSKADLLWILKRLSFWCKHDIDRALIDLAYEKETERINEAETYSKLSYDKRMEYFDLMRPYDGVKIADIPLNILNKAYALLDEAEAADKKFAKLMELEV